MVSFIQNWGSRIRVNIDQAVREAYVWWLEAGGVNYGQMPIRLRARVSLTMQPDRNWKW